MSYPVITIDGPSASGKGTLAIRLANILGYHYLDSGALYRMLAYASQKKGIKSDEILDLVAIIEQLDIVFLDGKKILNGQDVTQKIRQDCVASFASEIAVHPPVRQAILMLQKRYLRAPGLVCDGRDMGTVVFPDAILKVFVFADLHVRAMRRFWQLQSFNVKKPLYDQVLQNLSVRDERDSCRAIAPLKKSDDAKVLDTSKLTFEASLQRILEWCSKEPKIKF